MRKLLLFIFTFVIFNTYSQQENMINKSVDDVHQYVTEIYHIDKMITRYYSDQYINIYKITNNYKLSFHFFNDTCNYQKMEYPTPDYGEQLILKLDTLFPSQPSKSKNRYVWMDDDCTWYLTMRKNSSILIIKSK